MKLETIKIKSNKSNEVLNVHIELEANPIQKNLFIEKKSEELKTDTNNVLVGDSLDHEIKSLPQVINSDIEDKSKELIKYGQTLSINDNGDITIKEELVELLEKYSFLSVKVYFQDDYIDLSNLKNTKNMGIEWTQDYSIHHLH